MNERVTYRVDDVMKLFCAKRTTIRAAIAAGQIRTKKHGQRPLPLRG